MYTVYKHTTPSNKVYIGITSKDPEIRWRAGYRNNYHFSNAINFYGWHNIKHEILFTGLSKHEAETKEKELIAFYNSTDQSRGYNIAKGGHGNSGYKHSEITKNKIRATLTGQKHTKERVEKNRKKHLSLWKNEEYRRHMVEAHIGKCTGADNHSSKKVYQYTLDNKFIREYVSATEAGIINNIDRRQIGDCCKKKQLSCHGFKWYFEKQ